jgi:hypothetical protein
MSNDETIDGETVRDALINVQKAIDGELDPSSDAVEEAKEPGLNRNQRAVAERYCGEGRVTVDDSTTPNFAEKLASGVELPWTFVLDGVQFIKKASTGSGSNPSKWRWREDGFQFRYFKYDDRENEVLIQSVADSPTTSGGNDGQ